MGIMDWVMVVFLTIVLFGGLAGFFYYNSKEKD